jgi:hypothetical protein
MMNSKKSSDVLKMCLDKAILGEGFAIIPHLTKIDTLQLFCFHIKTENVYPHLSHCNIDVKVLKKLYVFLGNTIRCHGDMSVIILNIPTSIPFRGDNLLERDGKYTNQLTVTFELSSTDRIKYELKVDTLSGKVIEECLKHEFDVTTRYLDENGSPVMNGDEAQLDEFCMDHKLNISLESMTDLCRHALSMNDNVEDIWSNITDEDRERVQNDILDLIKK